MKLFYVKPTAPDVTVTSNIRAEMGRQRITIRALATKAGLNHATLSRRLSDQLPLTVLELAKIAHALGVTAESLLAQTHGEAGAA